VGRSLARVARSLTRRVPGGWWLDAGIVAAFCLLTVALVTWAPLPRVDVAVAHWCDAHRPFAGYLTARVLNFFGQGSVLGIFALCLAGWRWHRYRSLRPLLVVVVTYGLLAVVVGALKLTMDRAAPHATGLAHPERLFASPPGMSYPSGHVANTFAWYVAIAIILGELVPRRIRPLLHLGPPVLIAATTTYLGYHWVTDDVAGALVGALIVRVLLRVRWDAVPLGSDTVPVGGIVARSSRCGDG